MNPWLEVGLSNALVATGLALVAAIVSRASRNPKIAFAAWALVLAKLLMPPLAGIPGTVWQVAVWQADAGETTSDPPVESTEPPSSPEMVAQVASDDPPATVIAPPTIAAERPDHSATAAAGPAVVSTASEATPLLAGLAITRWHWSRILLVAWLSGSALWILLAITRVVRFQRLLRRARPADEALACEVATLAQRMKLKHLPRVCVTRSALPPLVWVWFGRATVLLPAGLMAELTRDERTTLLAHELAHLARRDHWARWLELAAICLYWWHPVAWWARRNLARAGEQCCDSAVVRLLPELAHAYARTLLVATEFCSAARPALPAGSSGFSQASSLKRRMEMILSSNVPRAISWRVRLSLVAVALTALPFSLQTVAADAPAEQPDSRRVKSRAESKLGEDLALAQSKRPAATSSASIEERLSKLEKAVAELTEAIKGLRTAEQESASPVVIKTIPEKDAEDVDPNLTELKVTFSKDMQNGSWSWTQRSDDTFPETTGSPHYLDDKRTCVLPVKLEPGKTYWISLNSNRFKNFKDPGGRPAIPYVLSFKTKAQ